MEVTLEAFASICTSVSFSCFNPYSNGSYSGRRLWAFIAYGFNGVSILILMEVTLEENFEAVQESGNTQFQSLF